MKFKLGIFQCFVIIAINWSTCSGNFEVLENPKPLNVQEISSHRNIGLINSSKCGSSSSRILGAGVRAGEFPWMSLLQYYDHEVDERTFRCGGSLISENCVLTVAHCLRKDLVAVRLGEFNISSVYDNAFDPSATPFMVQDIDVEKMIAYPKHSNLKKMNDIGLIRLKAPADLSKPNIGTICLPVEENNQFEKLDELDEDLKINLIIAGWEQAENSRTMGDVMKKVTIQYIPREECAAQLTPIEVHDTWICAGGKNKVKVDLCYGGGPLFVPSEVNQKVRFVQYGVSSASVACNDLRSNFPSIYTNVGYYIKWILDNMY